jgi:hypothetical protein
MKKRQGQDQTLGTAIKEAIRAQARRKQFTFQPPKEQAADPQENPQP